MAGSACCVSAKTGSAGLSKQQQQIALPISRLEPLLLVAWVYLQALGIWSYIPCRDIIPFIKIAAAVLEQRPIVPRCLTWLASQLLSLCSQLKSLYYMMCIFYLARQWQIWQQRKQRKDFVSASAKLMSCNQMWADRKMSTVADSAVYMSETVLLVIPASLLSNAILW